MVIRLDSANDHKTVHGLLVLVLVDQETGLSDVGVIERRVEVDGGVEMAQGLAELFLGLHV